MGPEPSVRSLAFSPDGKLLISGAGSNYSDKTHVVAFWNVQTGKLRVARVERGYRSVGVAFAGKASTAVSVSEDGFLRLYAAPDWSLGTKYATLADKQRLPFGEIETAPRAFALSPDGKTAVIGTWGAMSIFGALLMASC